MDKETVFREIRQSRALLWAGAGFSRYAGYPMGSGVVQALYGALSKAQQQQLSSALDLTESSLLKIPLPDFAQYFVDLHNGNRQRLVQVVTQLFSSSPTAINTHKQVATIPHFDAIVTTNYDLLFESSYGLDKLHVITQADNVPQLYDKPTTLFKIHGELNRPNTLIIAQNDYRRFFDKADDVVWAQLRSLMSARTIVFIGYAVEDSNVLDVFLELTNRLGELMRPAYVIGPSMDFLRIERLKRQNIYFIQASGEEFIEELIANINDNILSDVELGLTSADVFKKFMDCRDLRAKLSNSSDGFHVSDLSRKNGEANANIRLSLDDDSQLHNKFEEIVSGFGYEPLIIGMAELNKADVRIEDLKLPLGVGGEYRIILSPIPVHEGVYDFIFDNFEIANLEAKVYRAQNGYKAIIKLHTSIITLDAIAQDGYVTSKIYVENTLDDDECKLTSTKEQIETYNFVVELTKGKPFKCFSHAKQTLHSLHPTASNMTGLDKTLNYFKKLHDIERVFGIKFTSFKNISDNTEDVADLHKAISGFTECIEWNTEVPIGQSEELRNILQEDINNKNDDRFILKAIRSASLVIHERNINTNIIISFKFINPVIVKSEFSDGMCLKSANNSFIATHSYDQYDESSN